MLKPQYIWPRTTQLWLNMPTLDINTTSKSLNTGLRFRRNVSGNIQKTRKNTVIWLISCLWCQTLGKVRSYSVAPKKYLVIGTSQSNKLPNSSYLSSKPQEDKRNGSLRFLSVWNNRCTKQTVMFWNQYFPFWNSPKTSPLVLIKKYKKGSFNSKNNLLTVAYVSLQTILVLGRDLHNFGQCSRRKHDKYLSQQRKKRVAFHQVCWARS